MIALLTIGGGNLWATKKYATYGTPAANGAWNAETSVYTWTGATNNLMTIFEFPNGELADYTSIHLTTADYTGVYRICFMKGSTKMTEIVFYSAGQKDLVLASRDETKNLDLSQISHISFGGATASGSITLSKAYLEKPFELSFDDNGNAAISVTDLVASGCLSLDDETGVLTSTLGEADAPTWGRLSINFPTGGVDLTSLTGFSMSQSGTVLFNNFEVGNKGFWSNVTGRSDLSSYMTADNVGDPAHITTWRWNVNAAGTMTITSLNLTASVMTAVNPHETLITTLAYVGGGCTNDIGKTLGQGATIYGKGNDIDGAAYVDLSGYDELRLYGTSGKSVRLLFNYEASEPIKKDMTINLDADGYYSLDLSTLAALKLNAIKFPWDGQSGVVAKVVLYKEYIPVSYSYVFSGTGAMASSAIAALSDASATLIDATGVTGTGITLTSANPNAIFIANTGVLSNTSNVMVGTTIANLVVTDDYPMAVPTGASATAASYTRTMANTYGTVCLPFEVTSGDNYKYYTLGALTADELTLVEVATLPAGTPGVVEKLNGGAMTGSGALANVQAASGTLQLIGTFKPETILASDYSSNIYAISNNQFVQATNSINLPAFRAFFTTTSSESAIRFGFEDEGVTGVNALTGESGVNIIGIYSLDGAAQPSLQKGVNIVKFSDGGVKKIMVK